MASKRRFKGCPSEDLCHQQHLEKQPHLEEEEEQQRQQQLQQLSDVVVMSDMVKFGRCELVFSQYELLRRIFAFLSTPDLFRGSLGKSCILDMMFEVTFLIPVTLYNTFCL